MRQAMSGAWLAALLAACTLLRGSVAQSSASSPSGSAGRALVITSPQFQTNLTLQPYTASLLYVQTNSTSSGSDPNIRLTARANSSLNVGLYCNPGWYSATSATAAPQPSSAIYQANIQTDNNTIIISPNDPYYRPSTNNATSGTASAYTPYFACTVINTDTVNTALVTFNSTMTNGNATLSQAQQQAALGLYTACCTSVGSCTAWKAASQSAGVSVITDLCKLPGQACDSQGNLTRLDLHNSNLVCAIPLTTLAVFSGLQQLVLWGNSKLTGSLADTMATLSSLRSLYSVDLHSAPALNGTLTGTTQGSTLPGTCRAVQQELIYLDVSGNNLAGNIPSCLFDGNSTLAVLNLANNALNGTIPDVFARNSTLETLLASNNRLSGSVPGSLANCSKLVGLDLSNNTLNGSIPAGLGNAQTLSYVTLMGNSLTGSVPTSLAVSPNLQTLDLKLNQLSVLPSAWYTGFPGLANTSLVTLRVSYNRFNGVIPPALGQLPELTSFIAGNNRFSGTLPSTAGSFPLLRALNLSGNLLNGTVPAIWGGTPMFKLAPVQLADGSYSAQAFDISYNQLSGSLPSYLASTSVPTFLKSSVFVQGNPWVSSVCTNSSFAYLNPCQASPPAPAPAGIAPSLVAAPAPAQQQPATVPVPRPATTPNISTSTESGKGSQPSSSSSSLSRGAVAGIVIGTLAGAALVSVLVVVIIKRGSFSRPMLPTMPGRGAQGKFVSFDDFS